MTNEELIQTLSVNYTKKCIQLDKLKKENLEFYELIQDLKGQLVKARQDIVKLEKDNTGDWIVKWVGYVLERLGGGQD